MSRRTAKGVDVVWLNCTACHAGTVRTAPDEAPRVVPGMPSNNLDFGRFTRFVLSTATDERLNEKTLLPAIEAGGHRFGPLERLVWRFGVLPRVREALIAQRARLAPLLALQPDWGLDLVDTFNPYMVGRHGVPAAALPESERFGAVDFPSIFLQGLRVGLNLHWDGNNNSLEERIMSAALGAGLTPETADRDAIERFADCLIELAPPAPPPVADQAAVERSKPFYLRECASCHGQASPTGYQFPGERLGQVARAEDIGTDRGRLDSYTENFRA